MPAFDGTGPNGQGSRTGRGMGFCRVTNTTLRPGLGRGFSRGFGRGLGRGFGRGLGRGFGRGSYGQGF